MKLCRAVAVARNLVPPALIERSVGSAFALQPPEAKLDLRITPSFGDRFRQTRGCHGACRFAEATAGAHGSFTLPVPFFEVISGPIGSVRSADGRVVPPRH